MTTTTPPTAMDELQRAIALQAVRSAFTVDTDTLMGDKDTLAESIRHVLHHFGAEGGYPAGSYISTIIEAAARADDEHRTRLMLAYPVETALVTIAQNLPNGTQMLQQAIAEQPPF